MTAFFRTFMETGDIFGFESLRDKEEKPEIEDDSPFKNFSTQWFMDSLARHKIGKQIKANYIFLNRIEWGTGAGSVRVSLTPNLAIHLQRLIYDAEGEPNWILKKVFMPNLKEFAGHEEIVAGDVFEEVEKLYSTKLDSFSNDYDGLGVLTRRMAGIMKGSAPDTFMYQDTKQVEKNHYIIYFSLKGFGVGKLATNIRQANSTPEATIELYFDKQKGLIHIILTTVTTGGEGYDWAIDIPYLDSFYAPTQSRDEIIRTVLVALKYH